MNFCVSLLLVALVTLPLLCSAQLSNTTDIEKHLGPPETKDSLTFVAVFLLTTLHGAAVFGGPGGNRVDFFMRVQASKATWGHPIKHFYAVVGDNEGNQQILANPQYCTNLTRQYHHHMVHASEHPKEEVYECAGIRVLYLPYCNHKSWGPMVMPILYSILLLYSIYCSLLIINCNNRVHAVDVRVPCDTT